MKLKYDVFQIFIQFKALVENQFSIKIKMFQSDGRGEYTSRQFQDFFNKTWLPSPRFLSPPSQTKRFGGTRTPHIVDTRLTCMVEAMHNAVNLINRLLSKFLDFISPYEK